MSAVARRTHLAVIVTLVCLVVPAATLQAAKVKKVDDTTVEGRLTALKDGKVVLASSGASGKEAAPTVVPLQDIVEITLDPSTDIPADPRRASGGRRVDPARGGRGGVHPIFDGKTLGDRGRRPGVVVDPRRAITGVSTPGQTAHTSTFIYWKGGGGELTDFELRFRYKITGATQLVGSFIARRRSSTRHLQRRRVPVRPRRQSHHLGQPLRRGASPGTAASSPTLAKVVLKPDGSRDVIANGLPEGRGRA